MNPARRTRLLVRLTALALLAAAGLGAYVLWQRWTALPRPGSPLYLDYLRAFQVGVAALDAGPEQEGLARKRLDRSVELVPAEPAGWANLGLWALRKNDLAEATKHLTRAHDLAPESRDIAILRGFLAERQGKPDEAADRLRAAVAQGPPDAAALFALAEIVSGLGGPEREAEYQQLLEQILALQPNNLPVLARRAAVAHQRGDAAAYRDTLDRFARLAPGWSARTQKSLAELRAADPADVAFQVTTLGNQLQAEAGYRRDRQALQPQEGLVWTPLHHFLRLDPPRPTAAPPDRDLAFADHPFPAAPPPGAVVRPAWLLTDAQRAALLRPAEGPQDPAGAVVPTAFVADGTAVRRVGGEAPALPFPGGPKFIAPAPAGVVPVDWDNDFRLDLLLAGAGGLTFYQQQPDGAFADVTAKTGLADDLLKDDYVGAWPADVEQDGDLDLIVARRAGPALLLRNNRDGTFRPLDTFAAVRDVRAAAWADLDNDGTPDAALLDAAGRLHVFANERGGRLRPWSVPADLGPAVALAATDVNDDGVFDLVLLRQDGALVRVSAAGPGWQAAELAPGSGPVGAGPGDAAVQAADLDNNGALDLVVAGPARADIYLADADGRYLPRPAVPLGGAAALDLDGDGRLDLLGRGAGGVPGRARNVGAKNYRWQVLWPSANPRPGDDRINAFAVGGEIEVRSGLLVQKQLIAAPAVHFGLGEQPGVDVARVLWPNGQPQWEWDLPADRRIAAEQRLKGSCPFLFTDDDRGVRFVADFMWGTPLGMYINAQTSTGAAGQTTEWLKVPGDRLRPRDGAYHLRVHANLWETDYFDQLALLVVDHPPGTEVFVDERFFLTPTPPKLHVTGPVRPVARAWDHRGADATAEVRAVDGVYLDRAGRGRFQGVTHDHWVEVDLGDDAPATGPLLLVARGWTHPTDSSINVALGQGRHEAPRPLTLEVPDGQGGWKVGRPALGFPAGKDKTMLIRLDGITGDGVSRRLRLRTNLEVYWDFLGTARPLDPALATVYRPATLAADLRYRGVTAMTQANPSSPEVPVYDKIVGGQPWRDLAGLYTRFGDVRELVARIDDRYVIANAGDEIALRFAAPPGPPAGWARDFLWECDGWTRDGDPNTRHGTTVLPLPAHGAADDRPPGALEDDPVYRRFPHDWTTYHTRRVDPDAFARGLRPARRPPPRR